MDFNLHYILRAPLPFIYCGPDGCIIIISEETSNGACAVPGVCSVHS